MAGNLGSFRAGHESKQTLMAMTGLVYEFQELGKNNVFPEDILESFDSSEALEPLYNGTTLANSFFSMWISGLNNSIDPVLILRSGIGTP